MMVRLWSHEVLRVFYDRLVSDEDRLWTGRLLESLTEKHFKEKLGRLLGLSSPDDDALLTGIRGLMFGDFMVPGAGEGQLHTVKMALTCSLLC